MASEHSLSGDLCKLFANLLDSNDGTKTKKTVNSESSLRDITRKKAIYDGFQTLFYKDPHLDETHSREIQVQTILFKKRLQLCNVGQELDLLMKHFEDNHTLEHYLPVLILLFHIKPVVTQDSKEGEKLIKLDELRMQDEKATDALSSCQIYKCFDNSLFQRPQIDLNEDDPRFTQLQSEFTSLKYIDDLDVAHRGLFGALTNPPKNLNFLGISSKSKFTLALETSQEDKVKLEESCKEESVPEERLPTREEVKPSTELKQDPWANLENLTNSSKESKGFINRSPYLCHAPLERMEELYSKYEDSLKLVDSTRSRNVYKVQEPLFRDYVNYILRGIESNVFSYGTNGFFLNGSPFILGLTPDCLEEVVPSLLECGQLVRRLKEATWQPNQGFVRNAFAVEVQNMLEAHDELVETVMESSSLMAIVRGTKTLLPGLRLLHDLWYWPGWDRPSGSGVAFLQHLVNCASASTDRIVQNLYCGYFISCARPFLTFLSNWIYRGHCCDPFNEYLIGINSEFLEKRDRSYWTDGFTLDDIHREQGPFVNSSIDDDAINGLYSDIYICGKTVNLLKLCHGENNFDQGPSLRIAVSLAELKTIRTECSEYSLKIPPEVQFIEPPKQLGKIAHIVREEKLAQLIAEKQARDKQKLADKFARNVAARAELDEQLELKRAEQRRVAEEDRLLDEDIKLYRELVDKRDAKEKRRLLMKYAQLLSDDTTEELTVQDAFNANEIVQTDNQNNILAPAETSGTKPLPNESRPTLPNETTNKNRMSGHGDAATKNTGITSSVGKCETRQIKPARKTRRKEPVFLTKEAIKAKVLLEEYGIDPRCDVQPVEEIVGKVAPRYQPVDYTPKEWNIPQTETYTKQFAFGPSDVGPGRDEECAENDWTRLCRPEPKEIFNLSLSFFVQRSLLLPVRTQCQMVNRSLMTMLIGSEHRLMRHLDTLRQFLFLDNGPFSYSLARSIGERLGQLTHAHQLVNVPSMNFILQTALNAVHADEHYASRLSFYIKETPGQHAKSHFDVLDCFTLRYRVEWPLNLILTEEIMDSYSQIFSFILQVRLAAWSMQDVFASMMKLDSDNWIGVHGARHGIEFFVCTMQNYVMSQLLNLAWNDFVGELKKSARSLDDLYNIHASYVHRAKARLLLTAKSASLMKIIRDALGLSLKFRSLLLASDYRHSAQLEAQVNAIHSKAKEYAKFIRLILEKASDRTQQSHLIELLLKLNYNQFYN